MAKSAAAAADDDDDDDDEMMMMMMMMTMMMTTTTMMMTTTTLSMSNGASAFVAPVDPPLSLRFGWSWIPALRNASLLAWRRTERARVG